MRFRTILVIVATGLLSMGTVVKKKDAIQKTQTDPIGYQEVLKEEEGGKKGPPVPALELFPKERFLSEGPVGRPQKGLSEKEEESEELWFEEEEEAPEEGEGEEFKLETDSDDMWEESPEENPFWDEEKPPEKSRLSLT